MKKVFSILLVLSIMLLCTGCRSSTESEQNISNDTTDKQLTDNVSTETDNKSLIVYFSWSGNTENVANSIQLQTNADIFEIVPEVPYTDDYDALLDLAQEEQRNDIRPAIANDIKNINDYDVVYVGFPNWWGDMPMILYTFFDTYDLSNKTIAPFCTSGGSGMSNTVEEIKNLEENAIVTDGLHVGSSFASDPENDVTEWLQEIGQGN